MMCFAMKNAQVVKVQVTSFLLVVLPFLPIVSTFHLAHVAYSPSFRSTSVKSYMTSSTAEPKISKLEGEFRDMLNEFYSFSERDIAGIDSYKYRALFEGVAASSDEPEVSRAFTILFEDFVPIRIAGRMIYKHLKTVMEKSTEKRLLQEENIIKSTALSAEEIYEGRKAFLAIDVDEDGQLTIDELVNSGLVETAVTLLGFESFTDLLKKLDKDERGKLDFEMFMIGMQRCMEDSEEAECDISQVLNEVITRMEALEQKDATTSDAKKAKYGERYDSMVEAFKDWEDLVPSGNGRMIEVFNGCFYGAKNKKIVGALKIVYTDYSALRMSGDLIFKLTSKLVGKK
uniref:Calmodulin n=1 Tax=Leptocylindrus danicus TaxID=163516 RepID=A0A7S2LFC0_9STRA|mmetsp:Transcript_4936/g.7210  ORF Transcript_4936/g.7210 Transcript_4936/m.7210 type:complete len:344 (+) Transcript_4936:161-1192(+)